MQGAPVNFAAPAAVTPPLTAGDGVAAGRVPIGVTRGVLLGSGMALGLVSAGASVTVPNVGCSCGVEVAKATLPFCAP